MISESNNNNWDFNSIMKKDNSILNTKFAIYNKTKQHKFCINFIKHLAIIQLFSDY